MRLLPLYWLLAGISLFIAIIYFYKNEHNILFFDFINFPQMLLFLVFYIL